MFRPLSFVPSGLYLMAAASACSPSTHEGLGPLIPGRVASHASPGASALDAFAELPAGSVGPYLARFRDEALAVWAEPDGDDALRWVSLRLDATGRAFGSPRSLGAAPPNLGIVRVRAAGDAAWVVGMGELGDRQQATAFRLRARGDLAAPAATWLAPHGGSVVWSDVVPTHGGGALVFWAERVAETAQVFVQSLSGNGAVETPPRLLYEAARAWQVVGVADGALLGVVSRSGAVDLLPLASDGTPSAVARLPGTLHAEGEIDLLPIEPSRILVAFSEERWLESRVLSVFVNERGVPLSEIAVAVPERGPQVLRQLVGNASAPYLAWQDLREDPLKLRVTRLSGAGTSVGTIVDLPMDPGVFPELAASELRFATVVSACRTTRCPTAVSLVEFDRSLSELARTPLMIAERPVSLSWDLGCAGSACSALGAAFGARSSVALLGAQAQEDVVNPTWNAEPNASIAALLPTPELVSIAAQEDAQGTTIAWLSYFDPSIPYERPKTIAPDGRLAPVQAELRTQFVPAGISGLEYATKLPPSETISIRARSVAGVALARKSARQLLAWSAIDGEAPQVFMTELDERGHRLRQGMLTRQKGEVLTVRASATNNGWVIAWIDDRRGRPEAYLSLVGPSLERLTPDIRLELNNAAMSGLDVAFVNGEVWLAASDLQAASPALYVARYEPRALQLQGTLTRIESSGGSLRNPRLAVSGASPTVVWLEGGNGDSVFRRAELAPDGKLRSVTGWPRAGNEPGAFELACGATCDVIFGARDGSDVRLFSLDAALGAGSEARPLARLVSRKALEVGAASAAGAVYYYDVNADGAAAVHRLQQRVD